MMGINDALKLSDKKKKRVGRKSQRQDPQDIKPRMVELNLEQSSNDFKFDYDKKWENKEFLTTVEMMDPKSILYSVRNQPIALANGYSGYLQIMEIYGNDIASLSDQERVQVIAAFTQWLSGTTFDLTLQTTTLPTNTREQIDELLRVLEEVRYELLDPNLTDRKRYQLNQRQDILVQNIIKEEVIAAIQYNTEFFVWIFADSLEELESNTRLAQEVSYSFIPHFITIEKKEQILTQYYNYNDVV